MSWKLQTRQYKLSTWGCSGWIALYTWYIWNEWYLIWNSEYSAIRISNEIWTGIIRGCIRVECLRLNLYSPPCILVIHCTIWDFSSNFLASKNLSHKAELSFEKRGFANLKIWALFQPEWDIYKYHSKVRVTKHKWYQMLLFWVSYVYIFGKFGLEILF